MTQTKKKVSNGFVALTTIILVIAGVVSLFWSNIEIMLFGSEYQNVRRPIDIVSIIDINLKDDVLLDLNSFREYGQWPIPAVRVNADRGNPFDIKR